MLDNSTGEWLAWEGSGDYFGSDFGGAIDGVTTLRQPGSTLKPFTYALAFEEGFTPASVLADVPSHFATAEEGIVYTPRNYDGGYRGPLRARLALAGSENVPAVALLAKLGPPALLRLLRGAGFRDLTRTADYYGLGLTLGDAEVTLEQLVTAYATFARAGVSVTPAMLLRHATPDDRRPLVSPRTAFWITDILSDPHAREFIFGRGGNLDFPFPVAVKTGTSQAYHDNWTVGYTRAVTVGVWVGNFDRARASQLQRRHRRRPDLPRRHARGDAPRRRQRRASDRRSSRRSRTAADLRVVRAAAVDLMPGDGQRMASAGCAGRVLWVASRGARRLA